MCARVWARPQVQVLGGAQQGRGREGRSQELEGWKDARCRGPWQERAWEHRRGIAALGVTGHGMKGRGESVGTGRGVRPGGQVCPGVPGPQGGWWPVLGALGALMQLWASCLPFLRCCRGRRGKRARGTSRRAGTIIWILLCHLQKATLFLNSLTRGPAMTLLTFLTGAQQSSIH